MQKPRSLLDILQCLKFGALFSSILFPQLPCSPIYSLPNSAHQPLTPTHDSVFSFNVTSIEKHLIPPTPVLPKNSAGFFQYVMSLFSFPTLTQPQINNCLCNYLFKVCLPHWAESSMKARTSLSYSLCPRDQNSASLRARLRHLEDPLPPRLCHWS